jgi:hypothetical protein
MEETYSDALNKRERSEMLTNDDLLLLTVVIDSITEEEQTSNQTDKRHSRRVVAIKETALETFNMRSGLSLRKLRIKIYERSQSSTRSTQLHVAGKIREK